ncbi:hypothetical protein RSSM_05965 [Rhodopirellula sallentina SM41]|uniref:Uncharacterized protein n=1 Tax=Rhodopirellula sallentina SM41 TaxID=1263870 RepID=M5TTX5_9BACT|nr:hypothetical protein RSSM_05965 [Rhodopirellula sallentina SM41]
MKCPSQPLDCLSPNFFGAGGRIDHDDERISTELSLQSANARPEAA